MSAPDYAAWDLVSVFTIAQAAALWIKIEPECDSVADDACSPKVRALAREIGEKLRVGDPRDYHHPARGHSGFIGYDRVEHHYTERKVTRAALLSLANQRSERPLFLFKEDREQPVRNNGQELTAHAAVASSQLGTRERRTFLVIFAALAELAKIDLSEPYKAGAAIAKQAELLGVTLGEKDTGDKIKEVLADKIKEVLADIPEALNARRK